MNTSAAQPGPNVVPTSPAVTGDIAVGMLVGVCSAWLNSMVRLQSAPCYSSASGSAGARMQFAACRLFAEIAQLHLQTGAVAAVDRPAEA